MATKPKPNKASTKTKATDTRQLTLDGYDNFVSKVGLNNENSLSAGMYIFNLITRNRVQLEAAYRGSWVAGTIIDAPAQDMTRAGIDITTNEADDDIDEIQSAMVRKQIWTSLCNGLTWGDLYGGAISVIDIDGQDLSTPLNVDTIGLKQFKGLIVFDRWQLNPNVVRVITDGPNIGLPLTYQVIDALTSADPNQPSATGSINIHHSRVIRHIGIQLPYFQAITEMMWGESKLERLWDRLIAFDQATMSAANLIERANNRMVGVQNLREILSNGGPAQKGLEKMFKMMQVLQTNEGLTLLDAADTYNTTSYTFAGLSDILLQFGQQLAGASGIPLVRLFGQSPAGLSSTGESDIRMYYDMINAAQEAKLRDGMDKILQIEWRSTFGKPPPKDMEFSFVPLWQMSNIDKATVAKTNTETILGAQDAGTITVSTAMKELRAMSGDLGLFANITDEDIAKAEEADANEPPPQPDMPDAPTPNGPPLKAAQDPEFPAEKQEDPKSDVVKNIDKKPMSQRLKFWAK